jgi:hypothetical protein
MTENIGPIDAVLTWVDGDDPAHLAKRNAYLQQLGFKPKSASDTRFRSVGEIFYSVKSLCIFAPYLRTIFIVTDQQTPDLAGSGFFSHEELDRIRIVDHREIYQGYEDCLPTFNSLSIETMLFRIPGLAERFIYLNDDFFLIKLTSPDTFFPNGNPLLRGEMTLLPEHRPTKIVLGFLSRLLGLQSNKQNKDSFKLAQAVGARMAGFERRYLRIGHTPHPIRTSTLADYYRQHPDALTGNIQFRLRHADQHSPVSLANHLELKSGNCRTQKNINCLYLKSDKILFLGRKLANSADKTDKLFSCVQSLDKASLRNQETVLLWLRKLLTGCPAP